MAAMVTVLTEFSDKENQRVYTQAAHTVQKPMFVIQRRRVPSGKQTVQEDVITVLSATEDSDGVVLPQRVSFAITVRRPISGDATDVTAMLAVVRDIVAGDEFTNTVNTSEWLV